MVVCGHGLRGDHAEKRFFPSRLQTRWPRKSLGSGQTDVQNPASCQPLSRDSLWPADDHVFFYGDKKALRVGDIITVRIVENAQASNTADTDLSRNSTANAEPQHLFW